MSELRVLAASVLLAGGVAAAVSAAVLRYGPTIESSMAPGHGAGAPARIATVRLGELAADHAMRVARAEASPGETAAATRAWAAALEYALVQVALERRAVLLPARAVAAGAPDLTAEIEAAMAAAMADPMADRTPTKPAPETKP